MENREERWGERIKEINCDNLIIVLIAMVYCTAMAVMWNIKLRLKAAERWAFINAA